MVSVYHCDNFLLKTKTRYQYQTRGKKRSPEFKITGNLSGLRKAADEDDILLFQRGKEFDRSYKLVLVKASDSGYKELRSKIGGRRSGSLSESKPITEVELRIAVESDLVDYAVKILIDDTIESREALRVRLLRCIEFRRKVIKAYGGVCAVCGEGGESALGHFEIEAVHIVPHRIKGISELHNGMALCRRHHWALDLGMFCFDENRRIRVSPSVFSISRNSFITIYHAK